MSILIKSVPIWAWCLIYTFIGIVLAFIIGVYDDEYEDGFWLFITLLWPIFIVIVIFGLIYITADECFKSGVESIRSKRFKKEDKYPWE